MKGKKFIELGWILDLDNYTTSLNRWLTGQQLDQEPGQKQVYFDKYIRTVKPLIHRYHQSYLLLKTVISSLDP
jgi:hypothetical protein